jgi:hypothetical protein
MMNTVGMATMRAPLPYYKGKDFNVLDFDFGQFLFEKGLYESAKTDS